MGRGEIDRIADASPFQTSLDWNGVGEVPRFALDHDGSWCDAVFFYEQL